MNLGLGHRLTTDRRTVPETAGSLYCNLIGSLCQHPAIRRHLAVNAGVGAGGETHCFGDIQHCVEEEYLR